MELNGRTFRMWTTQRKKDNEIYYWGFGNEFYAGLYSDIDNEPVVEVDVTIDPAGTYWAMYQIEEDILDFIYPNEHCFRVCFTYGPEDEEERGRGKIVKCVVKEIQ